MKILTAEFKAVLAGMRVTKPEKISVGIENGRLVMTSKHVRVALKFDGSSTDQAPREIAFPKASLFKGKVVEVAFEKKSVQFSNVRISSTELDAYHLNAFIAAKDDPLRGLGFTNKVLPAIQFIQQSLSTDLTRPHLNMILIDEKHIVSTDGHRMHWVKHRMKKFKSCKIHGELIRIFTSLNKLYRGTEKVRVAENLIVVDDHIWISSLGDRWNYNVDADFPPYDQVTPKSHEFEWCDKIKTFDAAFKQLDSKVKPFAQIVIKPLGKTKVEFVQTVGEFELCATIEVDHELKNPVSYNVAYLQDAMAFRNSSKIIRWKFQGPLDPLVLTDGDYNAVIMPMRCK